jgi:hypothetical protein
MAPFNGRRDNQHMLNFQSNQHNMWRHSMNCMHTWRAMMTVFCGNVRLVPRFSYEPAGSIADISNWVHVDSGWGTVTCETVEVGNQFKGEFEGTTASWGIHCIVQACCQVNFYIMGKLPKGLGIGRKCFYCSPALVYWHLWGTQKATLNQPKLLNMTGGLKFSSLIGGNTNM